MYFLFYRTNRFYKKKKIKTRKKSLTKKAPKQQQLTKNPIFFIKKPHLTHHCSSLWSLEISDSCAIFGEWRRTSQLRGPMVKMKESGNEDWSLWALMWSQFCCWLCVVCEQVTKFTSVLYPCGRWKWQYWNVTISMEVVSLNFSSTLLWAFCVPVAKRDVQTEALFTCLYN